jgi:tRNA/rRNA methyltransferase
MYAGNVGACARLAANFDLKDFWTVSPLCDPKDREARQYAKGPAAEYLDRLKVAATLSDALKGCVAAVAFTRRVGEYRQPSRTIDQIFKLTAGGKVALVFGREDGGLSSDEVSKCSHICSLAVAGVMPSLNLSHAVAVVLARVFDQIATEELTPDESRVAPLEEIESLLTHWSNTANDARIKNSAMMFKHIQSVLNRSAINPKELASFRSFLSKVQAALGTRKR